MTTIDNRGDRFKPIPWAIIREGANHYAIWDSLKHRLATGGRDNHSLKNLSIHAAWAWSNIFNIVDRGGCGMCGHHIQADNKAHWDVDFKWICEECANQ